MCDAAEPDLPFHEPVRAWFRGAFAGPTVAQRRAWPLVTAGKSTLLLAPTGSGKTLAAFLASLDRLFFAQAPPELERLRVLYVSPLKALAVDVDRNLAQPIAGIRESCDRLGAPYRVPTVAIRSGDTPQRERNRLLRHPPDILITTPESLYLLLTSRAAERLKYVETVIVDEIHALAGTKRGAHLFLSLERLEALRGRRARPLQRLGLSATARPLDEIARLLGGGVITGGRWQPRPVEILDAGSRRPMELGVEVPRDSALQVRRDERALLGAGPRSAFTTIVPRLVELVREHRSTMVFVNSRRLAERLASEINDAAGESLALAHHGSVAKDRRAEIERQLKEGLLPAIVATSSLELGIDMGAIDLVVHIEAPPSVAAGLQRIGRAGHGVHRTSRGLLFPKFRGDLLACAAVGERMLAGAVEATLYPRNPLDVLAQHLVAMTALAPWPVEELFAVARRAAPFAELVRSTFDGVLDLLSGRYPSEDFAQLRPRVVFDRSRGIVSSRNHARRLAVVNGGTIPDRGLFGVFLAEEGAAAARRVGELDEEMVYESQPGDVFALGASTWRIEDITHDKVLVSPAPGQLGKVPFWHGERPGRPAELGRAVGALARTLAALPTHEATAFLKRDELLTDEAAAALVLYIAEQLEAVGEVPTDETILVERFVDEVGSRRVCVLSPFGARVHLPWALLVTAAARARGLQVEHVVSDDGIVWRFPETDAPPDVLELLPDPADLRGLLAELLPGTTLFAARFRENAARALLLPRRSPSQRQPLWAQRKRSRDLLAVAIRYPDFPMLLETLRECLHDVFDLQALEALLSALHENRVRLSVHDVVRPSPFASAVLFGFVGSFLYDPDAPAAERRARALAVDQDQLRALLGDAESRTLLDADAVAAVERSLRGIDQKLRDADDLHDILLRFGHQTPADVRERCTDPARGAEWWRQLVAEGRALVLAIAGAESLVAVEDAARYRDALNLGLPHDIPAAWLGETPRPVADLTLRFARSRGPFSLADVVDHYGFSPGAARSALELLTEEGRLVSGEFLPRGSGMEWCERDVLRRVKRASLAAYRAEIEPVTVCQWGRFLLEWHHLEEPLAGGDALGRVLELLEGAVLSASSLEHETLSLRLKVFHSADLDLACARGLWLWRGVERLGAHDGKIAFYSPARYALLAAPMEPAQGEWVEEVRSALTSRGALFFQDLVSALEAPDEAVLEALWELVWSGEVTNDTLTALRSRLRAKGAATRRRVTRARSRYGLVIPGSEGRWSLLPRLPASGEPASELARRSAQATSLLHRYGILVRSAVSAEGLAGGYASLYPILRHLEDLGRVRRGWFVSGLGAAQFALPGADDALRRQRSRQPSLGRYRVLPATDPANPHGALVSWPEVRPRPMRTPGALVILRDGDLVAYLAGSGRTLLTFGLAGSGDVQERRAAAEALAGYVERHLRRTLMIATIDELSALRSPWADALRGAGFVGTHKGLCKSKQGGVASA